MGLYARIALLLGGFLLGAGLVYGVTSYEWRGFVELVIAGAGFAYLGLYARRAVRAADRDRANRESLKSEPNVPGPAGPATGPAGPAPAEGHVTEEVRPTIWPLVFSLAGAGIVAGVLANHWILVVGGLLAVAAAVGWFLEVLIQQRQQHH